MSTSGKVYYINESTGGVARVVSNYASFKATYREYIDTYRDALADTSAGFSPETIAYFERLLSYYESRLASVEAAESNGSDLWSLYEVPCQDWQQDPVRICLDPNSFQAPAYGGNSYDYAGYVYDANTARWKSFWGILSS